MVKILRLFKKLVLFLLTFNLPNAYFLTVAFNKNSNTPFSVVVIKRIYYWNCDVFYTEVFSL